MKRTLSIISVLCFLTLALPGCTGSQTGNTLVGAGVGGVGGALVGSAIGGTTGAVIGGLAGAATGAYVGHEYGH